MKHIKIYTAVVAVVAIISGFLPRQSVAELSDAVSYLDHQPIDSWVAMAMVAAGETPAIDLFSTPAGNQATDYELSILGISATGRDPRTSGPSNLVDGLKAFYTNRQIGDPNLLNDDFFGILAFSASKEDISQAIVQDSKQYILDHQRTDGGWGYSISEASDSNDTAMAISALLEAGVSSADPAITRAINYIKGLQNDDGGIPYVAGSKSDSGSDAWTISALTKAGIEPATWTKNSGNPLSHLQSLQLPDGSFKWMATDSKGSTVLTAYAVIALSGSVYPVGYTKPQAPQNTETTFRIEGSNEEYCAGITTAHTPMAVIEDESSICNYSYTVQTSSLGNYVQRINNDIAGGSLGWLYLVNYTAPQQPADTYTLTTGDSVVWYYGEANESPLRVTISDDSITTADTETILVEAYLDGSWVKAQGATVHINTRTLTTDKNGVVSLNTPAAGVYTIFAEKPGTVRSEKHTITVSAQSQNVDLTTNVTPTPEPITPTIGFTVNPASVNFGDIKAGEVSKQDITVNNVGTLNFNLQTTVSGDQLFVSNLSIDEQPWQNFARKIVIGAQTLIHLALKVPATYTQVGHKNGVLQLWASPAN